MKGKDKATYQIITDYRVVKTYSDGSTREVLGSTKEMLITVIPPSDGNDWEVEISDGVGGYAYAPIKELKVVIDELVDTLRL